MKKRDPLVQTLLSIFVPFYLLYWLYATGKDMEKMSGQKAPSILLLLAPAIIICISFFILFLGASSNSEEGSVVGGLGFILFLFILFPLSFALSLVYYYKFGSLTEGILGEQASRMLVFVLLWFISPAVVYIVQEKLNALGNLPNQNLSTQQQVSPQPPQNPTPPTPPAI